MTPEESREHWAIDQFGEPINVSGLSRFQLEKLHRLGNDFPSENATMKAIEKLRAFKRLKEKGFRFDGWTIDDGLKVSICTNLEGDNIFSESEKLDRQYKEIRVSLDLLFGGEE